MDLDELKKNFKEQPSYMFKRKLNELVRTNPKFFNLDQRNRKTIIDLVSRHSDKIKKLGGLSADTIRRESHNLYRNRLKNDISDEDLKDIKEILGMFKR